MNEQYRGHNTVKTLLLELCNASLEMLMFSEANFLRFQFLGRL